MPDKVDDQGVRLRATSRAQSCTRSSTSPSSASETMRVMARHRRGFIGIAGVCAGTLAIASSAIAADGGGSGIEPGTKFTPLAASTLTTPHAVRGSDGRRHIAYELELTNATGLSATVSRVEVRAPGVRRALADISGEALVAAMTRPGGLPEGTPDSDSTIMASSSVAIVWLDVILPRGQRVPPTLEHHVSGSLAAPTPVQFSSSLGTVDTARRAPVELGPPLKGGTWVADEGCCSAPTHHRRGLAPINGSLLVPQRFAIDWAMLDAQNRAWVGDPTKLTSYIGYGQPEIAAARGVVVSSVDGIKDNTPQGTLEDLPSIVETVGNHVIVRIAPGRFLLYGHMKRGSVRVKLGQHVRAGQMLGEVGNSGNSSTPHLHFQVLTRPTFFPSDSVPFTFRRFRLLGQAEPFTDEDLALRPTGSIAVTATRPGPRRDAMPLDLSVIRF
jgi:hypothetical protein